MQKTKRCMSCMKEMGEYNICMHCGWADSAQPMAEDELPVRTVIANRYLVGVSVSRGYDSIIYNGWDTVANRVVVIRELFLPGFVFRMDGKAQVALLGNNTGADYLKEKEAFVGRGMLLKRLSSMGLAVNMLGAFEENNTAYIITEKTAGCTLQDYRMEDRAGAHRLVDLLFKICSSLERIGAICPDLTPNDITLEASGKLLLNNTGRAFKTPGHRVTEGVPYNGAFAAPEGNEYGAKIGIDAMVYTFGAIAYYAISGRMPENGVNRKREDCMPNLAQLVPSIDERVSRAVQYSMELAAGKRARCSEDVLRVLCVAPMEKKRPKKHNKKQKSKLLIECAAACVLLGMALLIVGINKSTAAPITKGRIENAQITIKLLQENKGIDKGITQALTEMAANKHCGDVEIILDSQERSGHDGGHTVELMPIVRELDVNNYVCLDEYIRSSKKLETIPLGISSYVVYIKASTEQQKDICEELAAAADMKEFMDVVCREEAKTVISQKEYNELDIIDIDSEAVKISEDAFEDFCSGDYDVYIGSTLDIKAMQHRALYWNTMGAALDADYPQQDNAEETVYAGKEDTLNNGGEAFNYEVMPLPISTGYPVKMEKEFCIKHNGNNDNTKAAMLMLFYMLQENQQNIIHVQNDCSMPINRNTLDRYFDTYPELRVLEDKLNDARLIAG